MSSLEELGYFFDDDGVLKTKKDEKTFTFTTQAEYEKLGEAVTEEVYKKLEDECGLIKTPLKPKNGPEEDDEELSFIFVSKDCQKKETLLVLFHGSGVVRAGQWARRLIINNNLECGTQIPYIQRALKNDWGVVVLNTNHNSTESEEFKYSRTPVEHATNAWKFWVKNSEAKKIFVVAHSRGGYDMSCVLKKNGEDDRISAICLTDSPWFHVPDSCVNRQKSLVVVNFLARSNPDSFKIGEFRSGEVYDLYAGTKIHEWSSHCAIDAVFHIFENDIGEENFQKVMEKAKKLVKSEKEKKEENDEPAPKKQRV